MRRLKVEITAFDYKGKEPAAWFLKELSKYITPQIENIVIDDILRKNLTDLICLTIDPESYMSLPYNKNTMLMRISSRTAALNICEIVVSWSGEMDCCLCPWEEKGNNTISFCVHIGALEAKKLNTVLPMLYHPIVNSNESGLPFDYQIFYGGETLKIFFSEPICDIIEEQLLKSATLFVSQWNETNGAKICLTDIRKAGSKVIQLCMDFGASEKNAVEQMIHSLICISGIKKVICQ